MGFKDVRGNPVIDNRLMDPENFTVLPVCLDLNPPLIDQVVKVKVTKDKRESAFVAIVLGLNAVTAYLLQ